MGSKKDILDGKLAKLPSEPGVYLFKDDQDKIIYIGKAKILKNRVRSYFQKTSQDIKTAAMVAKIRNLDWIITSSEVEALLLENNLVKEHRPHYNIDLKDDKSFPFIRVTPELYPRIFITRNVIKDGSRYFGPYTNAGNLRKTMRIIHKLFPLRNCQHVLDEKTVNRKTVKLCLEYHLKNCEAPCQDLVSPKVYAEMVDSIIRFLNGQTQEIIQNIQEKMTETSKALEFEEAARYRDQLNILKDYQKRQNIVSTDFKNRDIISVASYKNDAVIVLFRIREGNVIGREHFYLKRTEHRLDSEIIKNFIRSYYNTTTFIPKELLAEISDEVELYEDFLSKIAGSRVKIIHPERGSKAKLLTLGKKNASNLLKDLMLQKMKLDLKPSKMVESLQENLNLSVPPLRIEGFDISTIMGTNTVASMVCFENGQAKRSQYRKFIIKTVEGIDDFASMREVITRRYTRVLKEGLILPDLVLIDGGKGQLNIAKQVLDDLKLNNIPIIGLAKRLEEVFIPGYSSPQNIPKTSPALTLLRRIRDEAHRFAITFHRKRRDDSMLSSVLDTISGIGKTRKKTLIESFGSVKEIQKQSEKKIASQCHLSVTLARKILETLKEISQSDYESKS